MEIYFQTCVEILKTLNMISRLSSDCRGEILRWCKRGKREWCRQTRRGNIRTIRFVIWDCDSESGYGYRSHTSDYLHWHRNETKRNQGKARASLEALFRLSKLYVPVVTTVVYRCLLELIACAGNPSPQKSLCRVHLAQILKCPKQGGC